MMKAFFGKVKLYLALAVAALGFAKLGGFFARFTIPGAGPVLAVLGAAGRLFFRTFLAGLWNLLANPSDWIAVGLVALLTLWAGYERGFKRGEGDLETYRQEAEVLAHQANAEAARVEDVATAAREDERKKIEAEHAAAPALAAVPVPQALKCPPFPKPSACPEPKVQKVYVKVPAKCDVSLSGAAGVPR